MLCMKPNLNPCPPPPSAAESVVCIGNLPGPAAGAFETPPRQQQAAACTRTEIAAGSMSEAKAAVPPVRLTKKTTICSTHRLAGKPRKYISPSMETLFSNIDGLTQEKDGPSFLWASICNDQRRRGLGLAEYIFLRALIDILGLRKTLPSSCSTIRS